MPLPTPWWAQGFALFLLAATVAQAQQATNHVFAARAEQSFIHAQKEFAAHPDIATNAWALGYRSFEWSEFATNEQQRADVVQVGIDACRKLLVSDPNSAPAHYYLGMNYGGLAQAEAPSLAAYRLIGDIEWEFRFAANLDEKLDYAGPVRCLGLLYRDAPSWPISIGSKRKARETLEHAAALAPDYPDNQMNLVESYIRWHQSTEAEAAWQKLALIWAAAKTNLAGPAWEPYWDDWITRKAAAKADFQKTFKQNLEP
ncbi:MAG TPA: hypothetical protein VH251_01665 [Verrucomicrobiae bacterium]|jgi:hypothetical protein|nr:hypothetical protein [Verrucomicrobiae bacterium]